MFLTGEPESEWSPTARAASRKKSKQPEYMRPFSEFPRNGGQTNSLIPAQEATKIPGNDGQLLTVAGSASEVIVDCLERYPAACPTPQDTRAPSNGTGIVSQEVTPSRLRGIDHVSRATCLDGSY